MHMHHARLLYTSDVVIATMCRNFRTLREWVWLSQWWEMYEDEESIQTNIWNYCSSFPCSIDWFMLTPILEENVKEYYDEFDSRIKICVVSLTTNIVQPQTFKNWHKAQYYWTFLNREKFYLFQIIWKIQHENHILDKCRSYSRTPLGHLSSNRWNNW